MTENQRLEKHALSMARSLEVEGANYKLMSKIILANLNKQSS